LGDYVIGEIQVPPSKVLFLEARNSAAILKNTDPFGSGDLEKIANLAREKCFSYRVPRGRAPLGGTFNISFQKNENVPRHWGMSQKGLATVKPSPQKRGDTVPILEIRLAMEDGRNLSGKTSRSRKCFSTRRGRTPSLCNRRHKKNKRDS